MTLVYWGLNLPRHFAGFHRSVHKRFAAKCMFLLAAHNAVSSANWDLEFCLSLILAGH